MKVFEGILDAFWKSQIPKKNDDFERIVAKRTSFKLRLSFNELNFLRFQAH